MAASFRIPMGYRFEPTDEELVTYFLFNKIFAETDDPFTDIEKFSVREGDLYGSQDPCDIWNLYGGDNLEDGKPLYLFTRLKKVSSNGSRISRRVGSGTWAGEDSGDTITSQNYVVGVKKRFRYENKKSPDNGAWIMHEFAVDPTLLRQHQKPDDIVLCRMKKNPVAEKKKNPVAEKKKKRKLQQVLNSEPCMLQKILNSEPCMSSKRSKLVEPQPVPISVQQYQQQTEFNSHMGSTILQSETEVVDSGLMFDPDQELLFSLEEEDSRLMFSLEQLLESDNISDDEPCMCSKLVEPPPVPISVQQYQQEAEFNSQHTGLSIESEPLDARLMYSSLEEEELLNSIDQLLQSDDESMAAETQEISAESSTIDVYHPNTTISVQQQQAEPGWNMVHVLPSETEPMDTSLMFDPQELLYGLELDQFLESMAADQTQVESKAERLMCTYSLKEEELLYSIELDQLLESDDESMAAVTQEISGPISARTTHGIEYRSSLAIRNRT
ncbi:hypothetical protein LWI29_016820 [Acer saccharum]|uniref:NAC domain-containing protein n=1 Tax=Acer saccharum TaxID=4024 RepID=A0AA39S269_ACESA|nr:hypothetical protein LWI29_016820 [Acer saccharum]